MKFKPTLITFIGVLLFSGLFLVGGCWHKKNTDREEVIGFLTKFNNCLNTADKDALNSMFVVKISPGALKRLLDILKAKNDDVGSKAPFVNVTLDVEASDIKIISNDLVLANVRVELTHPGIERKISSITLKIQKINAAEFKILKIDAKKMASDYKDYLALQKSTISGAQDAFNPALYNAKTLAVFKTAAQLKPKYDSVLWFTYSNGKTYYYVLKGKWNLYKDLDIYSGTDDVKDNYKMGLVGPDLKEIIPVEYTLVHNIGSTLPGLIEVENGDNKGLFDLNGKEVVPAKYNRIYPIDDENNLAVLQDGHNYYFLEKNLSISAKADIKLADFFTKIKKMNAASDLQKEALNYITEFNSPDDNKTIYLPPAYLVDLDLAKKELEFPTPTRKEADKEDEFGQQSYNITPAEKIGNPDNWFLASFYAIKDYYIDARYEFYDGKGIVIVDKRKDKIFTHSMADNYVVTDIEENGGPYEGPCNINSVRALNDTLFEVKGGANLRFDLYDKTKSISGGPYYHYYSIKGDKLVELQNKRNFGFTKYVKLDDSYLTGCYTMLVGHSEKNKGETKKLDGIDADMLRFMKNEIYADYKYQFKDDRWQQVFFMFEHIHHYGDETTLNAKVDDSLTKIDKYNINWINQKLKEGKSKVKSTTLAAR